MPLSTGKKIMAVQFLLNLFHTNQLSLAQHTLGRNTGQGEPTPLESLEKV